VHSKLQYFELDSHGFSSMQALSAPGEGCRATQHRKGGDLIFQQERIHKLKLGISTAQETPLVYDLTELG
jgi:hypothetical protein